MNTSKPTSWILGAASLTIALAFAGPLASQAAAVKSPSSDSGTQWSAQVERIDSAGVDISQSFQIAIYENLLEQLNKTKRFKQVFREGDSSAREVPNLLIVKTKVVKYTPGSETKRAVTTVAGATKLTVQSQLVTREGKVVLDRTVQGNVRFFGDNLHATQTLARNVAKLIKKSSWSEQEPANAVLTGQLSH